MEHQEEIKWLDRDALMIEIVGGINQGVWRHARWGNWRKYTGSAFSAGECAPPDLQAKLDKFADI